MDFKKLPTVLTSQELIDKAFRRARKVGGRNPRERALNKLATISNVTNSYFNKIISSHPSYENLPGFYREMVDILVGIGEMKKSLAALKWADSMIQRIINKSVREIKRGENPYTVLKSAYGRIASVIEQIEHALEFLNQSKQKLKEIPTLKYLPCVTVAGYPNVGKSSFVARISNVKPEIATYPFTTKKLTLGFLKLEDMEIQIIDTPGLLDRPITRRNKIEKRAILCLKYLADLIVFIIDPTETCGYSLERQLSLLRDIRTHFKKPILEIYSKSDMHERRDRLAYSATTGEGLDNIVKEIIKIVKEVHSQTSTVIAPSGQTSTQEQHS